MQRFLKLSFFSILLIIISCTKDKLKADDLICETEVTFEDVRPIINSSCAYSGCHVTGFVKGDYTSYTTMRPQLDNGLFEKWVINDRQMPPSYAPADKPKSLTEDQLNLIKCWAENGYPER